MDSTSVALFVAEVLLSWGFLIFCNMYCVVNEFLDTQVLCRRDRNYRDSQHLLHGINVHRAAVGTELVHHIEGYNHWYIELQ